MHALYLFLELEVSCVSTPSLQKSIIIGQVAWNNLTTCEFPRILASGRSPGTIRPLASSLAFQHRAGRLEQLDHLRIPSHFSIGQVAWNNLTTCEFPRILSSGRSPGTIRPLASSLAFFFIYRAGRLEQFDHLRVPSHFIIRQVAWNNLTTHKFLCFHFHQRAGRLEQLDQLKNLGISQHRFSLQNLLCKVKRK